MRLRTHASRTTFRRAVWASAALHAAAACALFLISQANPKRGHGQPVLDTCVADAVIVRMGFIEDEAVSVEVKPPMPEAAPATTEHTPPRSSSPQAAIQAQLRPQTLPSEMLALIQRLTPQQPAAGANRSAAEPPVKQAGGAEPSATPTIHGALSPNQTIVYVLDCSGSMGTAGRLDAARSSLIATLKQQPATVRFQIIVYSGTAAPLLSSGRGGLEASETNIRAATERLAELESRGGSNHLAALREALNFQTDVILILTDEDDLDHAAVKRMLAAAAKPVPVCISEVTAQGVQPPQRVK